MTLRSRRFISLLASSCLWLAADFCQPAAAQSGSWTFAGPPGAADRIVSIVVDPRSDSVLHVAAPGGGVWKSEDAGATWTPKLDLAPSLQVCSLAIDPRLPDVIYAGTGDNQSPRASQGIERSTDGGATWTFPGRFTNQPVCSIAVDPANSDRILAGSLEGLFASSDAGATWNKVLATPVTSIAFDGQGGVYAGTLGEQEPGTREGIVTRSLDGGRTWTPLKFAQNPNAAGAAINWVTVSPSAGVVYIAASYQPPPLIPGSASSAVALPSAVDFYRTVDAGVSWSATFGIGQARPPMALIVDQSNRSLYFAGSTLLISVNQGSSWRTVPTTTGDFHTAALLRGLLLLGGEKGLETAPLIAGGPTRAIARLPVGQFLGVSVDSGTGQVWAAGPSGLYGISPLLNGGGGVVGVGPVGTVAVTTGGATNNIFAAGNKQVFLSTSGSSIFSVRTVIPDTELRAPFPPLVLNPLNEAVAFVAGRRLYRTADSGANWATLAVVDPDVTHVVIAVTTAPASGQTLYAATACLPEVALVSCPSTISQVWRSANGGQSWTQVTPVSGFVSGLAVDPRQNNTIYAAIGAFPGGPSLSAGLVSGDVLQSTNGGMAWTSIRSNLSRASVNTILIDPASIPAPVIPMPGQPPQPGQFNLPAQTLYIGTDAGVFVTFNAGAQWSNISAGLPRSPVTRLSLQPGGVLLAATFGRGIYRTTVDGLGGGVTVNPLSVDITLMKGASITVGIALANSSVTATAEWQLNALNSWITVPEPYGTLRPRASSREVFRISAEDLQPGDYAGQLQLVTGSIRQEILVQVHVTASPGQITIVSGNNAVGGAGAALPPLQVMVTDDQQLPLSGVVVTFTTVSGGGFLSARTAVTNSEGIASTILTLPADAGIVNVEASSGGFSVTFTETAVRRLVPTLLSDSVVDGVTFNVYTSFGPGSLLLISGQNLAGDTFAANSPSLPSVLETTRVLLGAAAGDVALPLLSVSPHQIKALLPPDVLPGTYNLRVEVGAVRSSEVQVSVAGWAPGIFTLNGSGRGQGAFFKDDGSPVTAANPAERGSRVTFYAAGLGPVNPPVAAGQPGAEAEPFNRTLRTPRVFFDSYSAEVLYSGLAPGVAGRYQVAVRVPLLVSSATNISVSLTIGGFASNRVTIPVK